MMTKRKARIFVLILCLFYSSGLLAKKDACSQADAPAPPILKADLPALIKTLEGLKDTKGRTLWIKTPESEKEIRGVFEAVPVKTKLEQFFQLLFLLQKGISAGTLPIVVQPPGITEMLLTSRVFTDPVFPRKIVSVALKRDDPNRPPLYTVHFALPEVRFPINEGQGFATWDQGMCQIMKDLVFYDGFSFRLRRARNSKNLVVYDFDKVEFYGQFGTRRIIAIDLNYVELEKVEFIAATDQGKVQVRVAQREFKENKHSRLFKFIGTLIPNTSRQRIDW